MGGTSFIAGMPRSLRIGSVAGDGASSRASTRSLGRADFALQAVERRRNFDVHRGWASSCRRKSARRRRVGDIWATLCAPERCSALDRFCRLAPRVVHDSPDAAAFRFRFRYWARLPRCRFARLDAISSACPLSPVSCDAAVADAEKPSAITPANHQRCVIGNCPDITTQLRKLYFGGASGR